MLVGHTVGDAQGRVIAADERVCDLLHRTSREVTGLSYLELTHPDDRVHNRIGVDRLKLGDPPSLIRKRYLRPDGSCIGVDLEVSRLSEGLGGDRLVGTVRLSTLAECVSKPERLLARARQAVEVARRRNDEFGSSLAGDHAWSILLQLYLAEGESRIVNLDEICDLMKIPASVATRWALALKARGLVEDAGERRTQQLTATGFSAIERALDL